MRNKLLVMVAVLGFGLAACSNGDPIAGTKDTDDAVQSDDAVPAETSLESASTAPVDSADGTVRQTPTTEADGSDPSDGAGTERTTTTEGTTTTERTTTETTSPPGPTSSETSATTTEAEATPNDDSGEGTSNETDDPTTRQGVVEVLAVGDTGENVEALQRQLADGPFDPGPVNGTYGLATKEAVWALEKLADISVDGRWGPEDAEAWQELMDGEIGTPVESHRLRWVEIDLSRQIVSVYDPGQAIPRLVTHASTGTGRAWSNEEHQGDSITPLGAYSIGRRIDGWRESSLDIGRLYNPLYFNRGIALHGAESVPAYPASHGCVRVPMHVAEYLPAELPNGTPVHVLESEPTGEE